MVAQKGRREGFMACYLHASGMVRSPGEVFFLPGSRFLIASLFACLIPALGGQKAHAQQFASASLTLRGSVPSVCSIGVTDAKASLNLTAGQAGVTVATVEERCNAANGYTVNLASANGGRLASNLATVGYTLSYDQGLSATNGNMTATRSVTGESRRAAVGVSVPASPNLPAGDYTDTVIITIAAK
jgi:spore coat protein U-like protein